MACWARGCFAVDYVGRDGAEKLEKAEEVRIVTGVKAMPSETGARLTANDFDIAGDAGACSAGIVLIGAARFAVNILAPRRNVWVS